MNAMQGKKQAGQQCNRLLDEMFTILKYKNIKTDNGIYIKVFTDGTVSCLTVSTDYVLNTTNIET